MRGEWHLLGKLPRQDLSHDRLGDRPVLGEVKHVKDLGKVQLVSAGETLGNLDNWGEGESRSWNGNFLYFCFVICRVMGQGVEVWGRNWTNRGPMPFWTLFPRYNKEDNQGGWAPQALSLLVKLHLFDHSTSLGREFIRGTREKLVNYSTHKTRKRKHCTQSDPPRIDRPTSSHSPGTLM